MEKKEEKALVLDYLPYGYPLENKMMPVAQVVGINNFTLLQLVPRRGMTFEVGEEVYIGEGKRDKVQYILGRCPREKLTETSKIQLEEFIQKEVEKDKEKFIVFFNEAQPINTRLHQFELLPGFGKKHTHAILEAREEKPFASFDDLKKRVPNIPDPVKAVEKRLMEELTEIMRHNLFLN
ncbi:DNA-binding protein [Candidatus Pacearchaeota archaeon]|nr:DNA-binding protein [Candidatus Pacearchaeota archaeon]|tara:strand:- start:1991 stop:2530 length:540 start_codon:yes stop_codon:yes gene_type:complete